MDQKEARETLRQAGFARREITRLMQLRRKHACTSSPLSPPDNRRLEFVRWLFVTGKLTDHVV